MSDEGEKTCPLCAEEMDLTDQQLKPCKCGYEICVWCWHHIMDMAEKDDTEGRCPACRTPYDKDKIVGMAANCERLVAEINMERRKSQKAKTKPSEGRKQLSSVRVIQRNLVYIVGLPLNLADEELLQQKEYFGQYGKVLKVSMSRTAAGVIQQFPNNTCSVYITYLKEEEAIRCIQSVHGFILDGRSLKACFGTTKYCHAWLRNVPCTNPDCLYLHEIGSQEDSFTKDEIISAYTRSRVQQITGATNNMLRRSGNMLPPPIDDYCNDNAVSAAKPITKSASNNAMTTGRGSPPNGSSGRSVALPAAASWGMRASNQPQVANSVCSKGPAKPKPETVSSVLEFSPAVASTTPASIMLNEVVKKSTWNEESQTINGKDKPDSLKPVKQQDGTDCPESNPEKPSINDATRTVILGNESPCPLESSYNDWDTIVTPNVNSSLAHIEQCCGTNKEVVAETNGNINDLCFDTSSLRVDTNVRNELSGLTRTSSTILDQTVNKSPSSQGLQQPCADKYREPLTSRVTEKTGGLVNGVCFPRENFEWRTELHGQAVTNAVSELEEDIISFDNQRLKDPEVVSRTTCLPNSANSLHVSNHSRSHSLQQNEAFGAVNMSSDPIILGDRIGDHSFLQASSNSVMSIGFSERLNSSSAGSGRSVERNILLPREGEGRHMGRLQGDADGTLDVGESSIISNILSLDLDTWDDSLTSPQNLAKLLGENERQPSLKMSNTWKVQNSGQSRFSFARRDESRNDAYDADPSSSILIRQLSKNRTFSYDFGENRNSFLDKFGASNGFSCNFEEPESFASSPLVFPPNKPSVSRAQVSAPPGFSVPNRTPPPGFSSHERMDKNFDSISGNHLLDSSSLLRNSYQAPPAGNIGSGGDIEFMDPAILAVGKGRLQSGFTNPGIEMRSSFPQQLSAFENDARLQLLMQRSLSPHQNLRYSNIGDSFSSFSDSYGISSRLMDQAQVSNLSPLAQLSLQQSRNGLMSNGHWDGWNELQGGNNLGMAELLRNERLGFNKFYASGYEDSKFRMSSSGDLYNRTFEM